MTDTSDLFGSDMNVPILFPEDSARARAKDPTFSHRAADKSQATKSQVQAAVIFIVYNYGPIGGKDIDAKYMAFKSDKGWPGVARESPRKRAGDLERKNVLRITNPNAPRGTEALYVFNETPTGTDAA